MLGSPILYLKGMRTLMFQLSGFYYNPPSNPLLRRGRGLSKGSKKWLLKGIYRAP